MVKYHWVIIKEDISSNLVIASNNREVRSSTLRTGTIAVNEISYKSIIVNEISLTAFILKGELAMNKIPDNCTLCPFESCCDSAYGAYNCAFKSCIKEDTFIMRLKNIFGKFFK